MTGCKHSILKFLGLAGAMTLMLPRLALGELGVCPPYSRTFGLEDSWTEIRAFIDEINARPGGGTVFFEPGCYGPEYRATLAIDGVVCFRSLGPEDRASCGTTETCLSGVTLKVNAGGMLTLQGVSAGTFDDTHLVSPGGTLFAERSHLSASDVDVDVYASLKNEGFAYLRDTSIRTHEVFSGIDNTGTLVMDGGAFQGVQSRSFDGLRNYGYAHLDRVSIQDTCGVGSTGIRGIANFFGGVLNMTNSAIEGNGDACVSGIGYPRDVVGVQNESGATAHIVSSTIANNVIPVYGGEPEPATAIRNDGQLELEKSVVSDECGPVTDLGYNVGTCAATQPTSIEADPQFQDEFHGDSIELGADSPAIDRIPLALCSETDMLGRARTDGDGDGLVACDSGALEYGYARIAVTVRAPPYWREVGRLDLTRDAALFVTVFSTEDFDATRILFETISVERGYGLVDEALRGPTYRDMNRDGLVDLAVWYRLDRLPFPLCCAPDCFYDLQFSAMTEDGRAVRGQLKFEVVGCTE